MDLEMLTNGKNTKELVPQTTHYKIVQRIADLLGEEKFNYIVTNQNLKEVKKNNVELNSSIKLIKEFGKKLVDSESADINTFKMNIKEYCNLFETKRQNRLKDIEVFESETRELLQKIIIDYIKNNTLEIRVEFSINIQYLDLILVSNISSKGTLAKKCRDTLEMRIQASKSKQDRYDMRILSLENICFKNGLEIPLNKSHIQGIIDIEDDTVYQTKLLALIDSEVARNIEIKNRLEGKIKADEQKDAADKLNKEKQEVNNIFLRSYGLMEIKLLKTELERIKSLSTKQFGTCLEYAFDLKNNAITQIESCIWAKEKALEDAKKQENKKNYVTPTIPEEVPIEIGNRIYNIKLVFKIKSKIGTDKEKILKKMRKLLEDVGINDDSLVSLEVL